MSQKEMSNKERGGWFLGAAAIGFVATPLLPFLAPIAFVWLIIGVVLINMSGSESI